MVDYINAVCVGETSNRLGFSQTMTWTALDKIHQVIPWLFMSLSRDTHVNILDAVTYMDFIWMTGN